jgi:regulator of replication initiation timing
MLLPLLVGLVVPAFTSKHDPLTDKEIDEMREVAQEGDKRLQLLLTFAKSRLVAVYQIHGDPKMVEGRGQRTHDMLEDFASIIGELDRNIDQYANQKQDIRKQLKDVIEADAQFQMQLRALKEEETKPEWQKEADDYKFVLDDALDALQENADNARETLAEQNQLAKDKKLHKPQ